MAVQTVAMRNILATAYGVNATYGALVTTAPSTTTGTEVTGGTPAYTRIATAWSAAASSATTATAQVFNVPASTTVVGYELFTALTGGTYLDGNTVTSQTFASQGTYSLTPTFTQS